jgi:hypothetical protein
MVIFDLVLLVARSRKGAGYAAVKCGRQTSIALPSAEGVDIVIVSDWMWRDLTQMYTTLIYDHRASRATLKQLTSPSAQEFGL